MLNEIHDHLSSNNSAYTAWHKLPIHVAAHWALFIAISLLMTSGVVSSINNSEGASVIYVPSNNVAAVATASASGIVGLPSYEDSNQEYIIVRFKETITIVDKINLLARYSLRIPEENMKEVETMVYISDDDTPEEVVQNLLVLETDSVVSATVSGQ